MGVRMSIVIKTSFIVGAIFFSVLTDFMNKLNDDMNILKENY